MDNQHRQIKGYRELNQAEIDLMNEIKEKGLELQELISRVASTNTDLANDSGEGAELVKNAEAHRWAAIAKTHMQEGLMALTRAVAKPGFF